MRIFKKKEGRHGLIDMGRGGGLFRFVVGNCIRFSSQGGRSGGLIVLFTVKEIRQLYVCYMDICNISNCLSICCCIKLNLAPSFDFLCITSSPKSFWVVTFLSS